ncbi:YcxB family protein [Chitinophaga japonensis]|uniref:YcxB-like protein n=1 Tax=Chitinophaga japonensis TaxID=104662 RepID=A0A562TD69_CHIJA|nr:YcxB family protein [Chitinophaga japonensis]TWI91323.1 YcxB-like protein [Chitinophaga japonensis]
MHVEFSYNKEDVLHALRYHFLQRGEIKVFRNTLAILLLAAITGFFFRVVTPNALIGIIAMVALIVWAFWYLLPLSTYNKAATFKDKIKLGYSEEGLLISTRASDHQRQLSWNNFTQLVETRKFFFLYRDKKSFLLIPTSAFENEAARDRFSDLAKEKIS